MSRRLKKLVSVWLLALLAFAQGSLAFATCTMDRGNLAQMLAAPSTHDCCDEEMTQPMPASECVNLATADLKAVGAPALIGATPSLGPVLVVQLPKVGESLASAQAFPPPPAVPPRILLHSFQI